jgi:hypothetical protein
MMCIISKERIAFCAEVEGTRGEIFAVSPIVLQFRLISKERIAFCAQVKGIVKPRSEGDMERDGLN